MAAQTPNPTNSGEIFVDIVGITIRDRGQSCHKHPVCGVQLIEGSTVCLRKKVLLVDGLREVTVAVYLVMGEGGADGCRVGFAPRHLVKHMLQYIGALTRVKEVYSRHDMTSPIKRRKVHQNHGFAVAVLVPNSQKKGKKTNDSPTTPFPKKRKKDDNNNDYS